MSDLAECPLHNCDYMHIPASIVGDPTIEDNEFARADIIDHLHTFHGIIADIGSEIMDEIDSESTQAIIQAWMTANVYDHHWIQFWTKRGWADFNRNTTHAVGHGALLTLVFTRDDGVPPWELGVGMAGMIEDNGWFAKQESNRLHIWRA